MDNENNNHNGNDNNYNGNDNDNNNENDNNNNNNDINNEIKTVFYNKFNNISLEKELITNIKSENDITFKLDPIEIVIKNLQQRRAKNRNLKNNNLNENN